MAQPLSVDNQDFFDKIVCCAVNFTGTCVGEMASCCIAGCDKKEREYCKRLSDILRAGAESLYSLEIDPGTMALIDLGGDDD